MDLPATFDGRPGVTDTLGRALRDLRISVTDRCNFRCTYCMPKEVFGRDYAFLPQDQVLSFEEIDRVARSASSGSASRSCGSPAASRSSGATCRTSSRCSPAIRRPDGERDRPDADHERVGAAGARRGRWRTPGCGG